MSAPIVILDRDGVINADSPDFIRNEAEWKALPGSLEAIARLNHAGWRAVIVTNQSGIGRGRFGIEDLHAIHRKMVTHLAQFGGSIEAILFCPHRPEDGCPCRKPRTGLFQSLSRRLGVSLAGVPVIGDKASDLEAARAVGARPILVRTGQGRDTEAAGTLPAGVAVYDDLRAAADALLGARDGA
jgi:D-glycero-D-manno-heptose 1,7-bisphosphate phosphatase